MTQAENTWISIKDQKPICYRRGKWDGLLSDPILTIDKNRVIRICVANIGRLDGNEFFDFYEEPNDYLIDNITHWHKIPNIDFI